MCVVTNRQKMLKNPYQSFSDWLFGRWTCPDCGATWRSAGSPFFNDMTLVTVEDGEIVERRLECPECGFEEVLE